MTHVVGVAFPAVATAGAATHVPLVVVRRLGPRTSRVLAQAVCLGAVVVAPSVSLSGMQGLVLAQLVVAVGVFLLMRATRTPARATLGTLRIWGVGALVSLVSVTWLRDVLPHDLRVAQLYVLGALVVLVVLGRMRDAYLEAGTRIDAILATLPPPNPVGRADSDVTA